MIQMNTVVRSTFISNTNGILKLSLETSAVGVCLQVFLALLLLSCCYCIYVSYGQFLSQVAFDISELSPPTQGLVIPWWLISDPFFGNLHAYLFGFIMVLLIISYLRAWLSDPGSVPAGWIPP